MACFPPSSRLRPTDGTFTLRALSHDGRPSTGLQIKDAIAFPSSPKGVSEHLLATVLTDVRATGAAPTVSFGISADGELAPVAHLSGWKIKWLAKSYKTVLQTTGLTRRADFRVRPIVALPLLLSRAAGADARPSFPSGSTSSTSSRCRSTSRTRRASASSPSAVLGWALALTI